MALVPVLLAAIFLIITFAGLLMWRFAMRRTARARLRHVAVSRAWLAHYQSEDRS